MFKNQGPVYYGQYLKLNDFLACQKPLSRQYATLEQGECHDEMLFIVVHQAYELWFKQILHEFTRVWSFFSQPQLSDVALGSLVQSLNRTVKIQQVLAGHLDVLETMTPMDFLEFRNLLIPASGFQSLQFRQIEIMMGLKTHNRESIDREFFLGRLSEEDRQHLLKWEAEPSLLVLLEQWLERMPFSNAEGFDFWQEYSQAISRLLAEDEATIQGNAAQLSENERLAQLDNLQNTKQSFQSLLIAEQFAKRQEQGLSRWSQRATLNALFILQYREYPALAMPFQILTLLMDIDENFTAWRHRHALMAQRMLGTKIGTGGSSGHQYLKRAADQNRVYLDLFNLATFLIPRSVRPTLPKGLEQRLNFSNS